jgi:hypothetical protein
MSTPIKKFFTDLAKKNTIFSVTTRRKNDKVVDGLVVERAGDEYTSTYRLNVPATKKPAASRLPKGARKRADQANNVLTVYDMNKTDKDGNHGAFRRIDLNGVSKVKANGHVYTVDFDRNTHQWVLVEKK